MNELIMPCGDNCSVCPRYTAQTGEELQKVAELWYRVGYADRIVSLDEIKCSGCSSRKSCGYGLIDCIKEHDIQKCNQCSEFPCNKINEMLKTTNETRTKCKEVCSESEFKILSKAFFEKEINIRR
jgi:hypothetical protein